MSTDLESKFPCALTIDVPLPDNRLALIALRTLQVDAELSPLVHRTFSVVATAPTSQPESTASTAASSQPEEPQSDDKNVLRTEYRATTNRMLRVAVNGFMESLRVVLQVMEELDVDVLAAQAETKAPIQT